MKQFQDYKKYRILQKILTVPLTLIIFCFVHLLILLPIKRLFGTHFYSENYIEWILVGTIILTPVLIIPSIFVGRWISRQVEDCLLYRSREDIFNSLLITFKSYFIIGMIILTVLSIAPEITIQDLLELFFYFIIPISLSACLVSFMLSYFLPTKIFNINENLSGNLKE